MNYSIKKFAFLMSLFLRWSQFVLGHRLTIKTAINREYGCTDTRILNRTECEIIMSQAILRNSYRDLQSVSEEDLRIARGAYLRISGEETAPCDIHVNNEYIQNHINQPGTYSLSPYNAKQHFDDLRIPSVIQEQECLCRGCINPVTKREDSTNEFHSQPFQISIRVLKSVDGRPPFVPVKVAVTIGCTCVFRRAAVNLR